MNEGIKGCSLSETTNNGGGWRCYEGKEMEKGELGTTMQQN